MKTGGARFAQTDTSLDETHFSALEAALGASFSDSKKAEIESLFNPLRWDNLDNETQTWAETRPELEKLIKHLRGFEKKFADYANASLGTPKAAAAYLANQTEVKRGSEYFVPRHESDLLEDILTFREAAECAMLNGKTEKHHRPQDLNFREVVVKINKFLASNNFTESVSTDVNTGLRYSAFWEAVIDICSDIRDKPYAGHNSHQAALERVRNILKTIR